MFCTNIPYIRIYTPISLTLRWEARKMIEKVLIILFPLIGILTFIARNIIVRSHTQKKIRASDPLLKISVFLTIFCILIAIISTHSEYWYQKMGAISFLRFDWISYVGLYLFGFNVILEWFISGQLKESWRVGVHHDQKTDLIKNGIYAYTRNPYFLSYFIGFVCLFLVRPSVLIIFLIISTIIVFHILVLKEESYLMSIHGKEYEEYKNTTSRYLPFF